VEESIKRRNGMDWEGKGRGRRKEWIVVGSEQNEGRNRLWREGE
jgi:hypothetical protein